VNLERTVSHRVGLVHHQRFAKFGQNRAHVFYEEVGVLERNGYGPSCRSNNSAPFKITDEEMPALVGEREEALPGGEALAEWDRKISTIRKESDNNDDGGCR
jgi:hypothetical protein